MAAVIKEARQNEFAAGLGIGVGQGAAFSPTGQGVAFSLIGQGEAFGPTTGNSTETTAQVRIPGLS